MNEARKAFEQEFSDHKIAQLAFNAKFEKLVKDTYVPFEEIFRNIEKLQDAS